MARRTGLQAEVLASLAVVMILSSVVLGAVLVRYLGGHHAAREARLRDGLARALERAAGDRPAARLGPDADAWRVAPDGVARAASPGAPPIDPESLALADEARRAGSTLFRFDAPAAPIRLAAPLDAGGSVAVIRLSADAVPPARTSPVLVIGGVLLANAAIFTLLGVRELRRRVISPLQRLEQAARAVGEGGLDARLPVEGSREMAELAAVFNHMAGALERRTMAYEKAVAELREANRSLLEARADLDRAGRLAAVGSLAAGVAHEVGNPMGALLAFLDLVRRDAGLSEGSRRHLQQAREQGARVRAILRQLLDFSRPPQRPVLQPIDLAAVAEDTAALVRAQRRYAGIEIAVTREAQVPPARADRALLSQILLNLLLNAADALRGRPQPRVELRVGPAPPRAADAGAAAPPGRDSDAVECRISDNGEGIAAALRERVFDPFFSTKAPGEGSGLGLPNALRLAEELGGRLELLDGAVGEGAVFSLRLPVAASDTD